MAKSEIVRKVIEECKKAGLTADEILEGFVEAVAALDVRPSQKNSLSREKVATRLLEVLGVPKHIKGYYCLREAILIYTPSMSMTKELYCRVAETLNTTPSRVERAIRHSIEVAFNRCPPNEIAREFGNTLDPRKDRPSNSEVIAILAEKLENAMKN